MLGLIALVLGIGVGAAVWYFRQHGITQERTRDLQTVLHFCEQGASLAYGLMAEAGVSGLAGNTAAKTSALAAGVQHAASMAGQEIDKLGIPTSQLHDMVLAGFGKLLAVDPTITVGPGPLIASALSAATRVVPVQPKGETASQGQ